MRDLGTQNFAKRPSSQNAGRKSLGIIIAVIIVIGFLLALKSKFNIGGASSSVILKDAPYGLKPVSLEGVENIAEGGTDLSSQTAALRDLRYHGEAKAAATRAFGAGTYVLTVEATLPDPKNVPYQVWLFEGGKVLPIDFMNGSKTSWSLTLRDTDKYSSYSGIMITLERTKDNKPEERIMEGSF